MTDVLGALPAAGGKGGRGRCRGCIDRSAGGREQRQRQRGRRDRQGRARRAPQLPGAAPPPKLSLSGQMTLSVSLPLVCSLRVSAPKRGPRPLPKVLPQVFDSGFL